jgi:hypothetical protein
VGQARPFPAHDPPTEMTGTRIEAQHDDHAAPQA